MNPLSRLSLVLPVAFGLLAATACHREAYSPEKAAFAQGEDLIMREIEAYRQETRQLYNNRKFQELETWASEARDGKLKFANGTWKITHFYDSLKCREDEPESMWQLHEQIHQDWEKKFPDSITARVGHADFLTSYAWNARGTGYSNEVTEEGWRLFHERIEAARITLDKAKKLPKKCPVWWQVQMKVALGQSWSKADFAKLFEEAKAFEPQYFPYDLAQAKFLMPRWYGDEGDWEAAALKEIERPSGLGLEGYARVICDQRGYYDEIFNETKASWRKTRQGFELMRKSYPDSAEVLNAYCRLACIAEDRVLAKDLFAQIGDKVILYCWGGERKRFTQMKRWAED